MEVLVSNYVSINPLQWNLTNFKGTVMVFEYNNSITCLNYDTDPPPTVRVDLKWKVTSGDILIWHCLLFGDTHNAWNMSFFAGCVLLVNRLISVYKLKMSSAKMEVLVCSYWSQFIYHCWYCTHVYNKKLHFICKLKIKTKVSWSKLNYKIVGTYGAERIHVFKMFEKFPLPNEKRNWLGSTTSGLCCSSGS